MLVLKARDVVVTLADAAYLTQARQLFSSVHRHTDWDGDYLLLAHDVPAEKLQWFEDRGVRVINCFPISSQVTGPWPAVFLSKLYLFTEEMKRYRSVIYFDADCLVRKSLRILTKVHFLAARPFYYSHPSFAIQGRVFTARRLFNTGVMAFNTDIIYPTTFQELVDCFRQLYGTTPPQAFRGSPEELTLAYYFYRQWNKLPLTFNFTPNYFAQFSDVSLIARGAAVIHCAASVPQPKPWQPQSPFFQEFADNMSYSQVVDFSRPARSGKLHTVRKMRRFEYYVWLWKHSKSWQHLLDRMVGRFGLIMKQYFPSLYMGLKAVVHKR